MIAELGLRERQMIRDLPLPEDELFLGVDAGGTRLKAALYTADGVRIGGSERPVRTLARGPGRRELDPDCLWADTAAAIGSILDALGPTRGRIAGVGVTGFGNGLFLLDSDARPIGTAVTSTDTRAQPIVQRWQERGLATQIRSRTWHETWPGQPAPLLAWLKLNDAGALHRASHIVFSKDYIRWRLTGRLANEVTDLSSAGLIEPVRRSFDAGICELLDLPELATLLRERPLEPLEIAGCVSADAARMTGLQPGIPVVAGTTDGLAAVLGSGVTDSTRVTVVSGTWNLNQRFSERPINDNRLFATVITADPARFLLVDNSTAGAACLDWYVETRNIPTATALPRTEIYEMCDRTVLETAPGEAVPVFIPVLHRSTNASDAFAGGSHIQQRTHELRAVYEGVAFEHRLHVERLLETSGSAVAIRLGGGIVKSTVWTQMVSDVLAMPVEVPAETDLGALGAAMTAALGVGGFPNAEEACRAMTKIDRTVYPDETRHGEYGASFSRFIQAREAALRREQPASVAGSGVGTEQSIR